MMELDEFEPTLAWMDISLRRLLSIIDPPVLMNVHGSKAYRFEKHDIEQAIILKLARVVSGLRSAVKLTELGQLQEQAAICRMVDEFQEDVVFLAIGRFSDQPSQLHSDYLSTFFSEESHPSEPKDKWHKGKPLISRRKIHAFISNNDFHDENPSDHNAVQALLKNLFSGFVHAASSQVLEMYDPISQSFMTGDQSNSPFYFDYRSNLTNYIIRGCFAFSFGAAAFGDAELMNDARARGDTFLN